MEEKNLLEFGFINIDKPVGPTSFKVGQFVKEKLGLRKTSHLGTLDPAVSGVLPIALNRACKLNEYFMHRDKEYVGIMRLHEDVSEEKLRKEMKKFVGKIIQLPPKRSAVKRQEREREVKKFEILEINGRDVLFLAEVQAGTYIRKLCSDLGEEVGGAHMTELRRVRAGIFGEPCLNLYDFEKAVEEDKLKDIIIDAESAIKKVLPEIEVKGNLKQILTGKPLHEGDVQGKIPERFAGFYKKKFVGVYRAVEEGNIIARPEFVFN